MTIIKRKPGKNCESWGCPNTGYSAGMDIPKCGQV
jgi:hypothetical protein